MKRLEKIKNIFKVLLKKLESPLFGAFVNVVMLVIAIYALIIAKRTLDNADEQFQVNSITSDSLFNVQLSYSKKLNDSLILQISTLQKITNSQLQITNEQLKVSKEIYQDQLFSGRPIIVVKDFIISDTSLIQADLFSPKISTIYENVGKRSAIDVVFRPYIVYPDYSDFRASDFFSKSSIMEPNASHTHQYKPKIDKKYKLDFFYCFEISYYDKILDKRFNQYYYQHYRRDRNEYTFFECNKDDINKLRDYFKITLKSINEPPFDE